jgi:CheY-like chemotaxis protein
MIATDTAFLLYAEDDPDDRLLAKMAYRESGAPGQLVFVGDGEEALEFLRGTGRHAGRLDQTEPSVVILDLNMPGIDGREALRMIRADPQLRHIPVVILTTSAADGDIGASSRAGADGYIVKPRDFAGLVHIFTTLAMYSSKFISHAKDVPQ